MACENDLAVAGAPQPLELVRGFVNSLDVELATDEFATVAGLGSWLAEHDLAPAGARITEQDRLRAVELREALREVLLGHNGQPIPAATHERLNRAVASSPLAVSFGADGGAGLTPVGVGIDVAIARVAGVCREAALRGEWERLKVCPADDCFWAFYDRSRNQSRTWCQMGDCGNRAKVRAFRERSREGD